MNWQDKVYENLTEAKGEKKPTKPVQRKGETYEMFMRRTARTPGEAAAWKSPELSRRGVTPAVGVETPLGTGHHRREKGGHN